MGSGTSRPLGRGLHGASWNGDVDAVNAMLDRGYEVDRVGRNGRTALMLAAARGHRDVALALLQEGADADCEDDDGNTAMHGAARWGHDDCIRMLQGNGGSPNVYNDVGESPLHNAAQWGHTEAVEALIRAGAHVTVGDNEGRTPLHVAARWGHVGAAKALLRGRATPNVVDNAGATPLHLAAQFGHSDVVQLLLASGAEPFAYDAAGRTPVALCADQAMAQQLQASFRKTAWKSNQGPKIVEIVEQPQITQKPPSAVKKPLSEPQVARGNEVQRAEKQVDHTENTTIPVEPLLTEDGVVFLSNETLREELLESNEIVSEESIGTQDYLENIVKECDALWSKEFENEVIRIITNKNVGKRRSFRDIYLKSKYAVSNSEDVPNVITKKDHRIMATKETAIPIISDIHIFSGHSGIEKTHMKVMEKYVNIPRRIVLEYVKQCDTCNVRFRNRNKWMLN